MTRCTHRRRSGTAAMRQVGVSLVELMVAIALSLILLAGVMAIFSSSRTTYETTDRLSRLQENGRFALDSIMRDLRSSGYLGCNRGAPFNNALNESTNVMRNFAFPVQGYDAQGDGEFLPELDTDAVPNADTQSDVLVVRRPQGDFEPVRAVKYVGYMKLDTDPVVVPDVTPQLIKAGDIVQISDCANRAVFHVTANTAGSIEHSEAPAPAEVEEGEEPPEVPLGNQSGSLGFAFTDDAELMPMQTVIYYLRAGSTPVAAGDPPAISLWRRVSGGGVAEELVEGVERMQVTFGIADGDKIVYKRAANIGGDWAKVQTVRVALLVRSLSQYGTDTDKQSYDLLGEEVPAPGDRHMRQVFTTTVDIRNPAS
jgi:type IV pilus assembly protein PilW